MAKKNSGILMDEKGNEFYPKSANDIRQCDRRLVYSDICAFEHKESFTGYIGLRLGTETLDSNGINSFTTIDGHIFDYATSTHFKIYSYIQPSSTRFLNSRCYITDSQKLIRIWLATDTNKYVWILFEPSSGATWNYPNVTITNMSLGWTAGDEFNSKFTEGWQMQLFSDTSSFSNITECHPLGHVSGGIFNRGSWNEPDRGAVTQILDNSGQQHSVLVGTDYNGNRLYGIDWLDNTTLGNQHVRLYAGNNYLHFGGGQSVVNYSGKPIVCRRALFTNNANDKTYNSGTYVPLNTEYYNDTDGLIVNNNDGSFRFNFTGWVKVSFNVWLGSLSDNARPWVRLVRSDGWVYSDSIAMNSCGYHSFSISDRICYVTSGQWLGINVGLQAGTYRLDGGTGNTNSYIEIELL